MQSQNVDLLIEEADRLVQTASHELERAEEDVMAIMVCFNSRQSIVNYLSSYLLKSGLEINKPVSMESLLEQCTAEDDRFHLIDISSIGCNHDHKDEAYCTGIAKVSECLKIAKTIRGIALSEPPTY